MHEIPIIDGCDREDRSQPADAIVRDVSADSDFLRGAYEVRSESRCR